MPVPNSPSFRPRLEALEERAAPGSLNEIFGLAHRQGDDSAVLYQAASAYASQAGSSHGNPNPGVAPVNSDAFGKSYGQWAGQFWSWAFSNPTSANPLFDNAPVSAGQSGKVWFIGGTFTPTDEGNGEVVGRVTRDASIPAGTALFVPLVNGEASDLEGNGTNEAELRASAKGLGDAIDPNSLFMSVDGRSLKGLASYRVQSPLMTSGPLPAGNLIGASAGSTAHFVADGYHVILSPLSAGKHTLHFGGEANIATPDGNIHFVQDVTYNITVGKG